MLGPFRRRASDTLSGDPGSDIVAGLVNLLRPEDYAYNDGSLAWTQVNNSLPVNAATDPKDWIFNLDGWIFLMSNDATRISNKAAMTVTVSPFYQGIYIPFNQAKLIRTSQSPL